MMVMVASIRTRRSRCREDSNDRAQQDFADTPDRVYGILENGTSEAKENIDHETDPCCDIGIASCLARCVDRWVGGERRSVAALDFRRDRWRSEYIIVGEIERQLDSSRIAHASKILDSQSMLVIHHGQRKNCIEWKPWKRLSIFVLSCAQPMHADPNEYLLA